jgi:hypothetical protein
VDPDQHSHAIDEQGYKALGLLRSQGLPALIGVLQHLEKVSSKRQPQIKRLFQRYFTSEFTDRHKFMNVNLINGQTDINALLRQIAVLYPEEITWRLNRSYMLGKLSSAKNNELHFEGYVKHNLLNVKRLVHITGIYPQAFRIKRIEIAADPCSVKVSQKEKEKVMATSKAQSIMSSRRASMDVSRSSIVMDSTNRVIQGEANINPENPRDPDQCENTPSPFAAEQAVITEEEIKQSQQRKGSFNDEEMIDTSSKKPLDMFKVPDIPAKKDDKKTLEAMFDSMQIKVVGRENEEERSNEGSLVDEDSDDGEFDINKSFMEDPNKIS